MKPDTETGSLETTPMGEPTPTPDVESTTTPPTEGPPDVTAEAPSTTEAGPAVQPSTETPAEPITADSPVPESTPVASSEAEAPGEGSETAPNEATVPPAADFTHLPIGPKPKPPAEKEKAPRPARSKQPPPPPRRHPSDAVVAQLSYVIVNEAGASVYSASPVGREEFPDLDATTRGTVSIGRRLQDPLSELVKIEPQNIGVGLYQHDVNPKQLKESLETVIESCVNFVGVDLNTASVPLLRHVSGLNALTARRLVERRGEQGPFTNREQLREIEGIGDKTYTQAAGFLKIRAAEHPLDRTWVHPESYEVATRLLEHLGYTPADILDRARLTELNAKLAEVDVPALARELNVGEPTLADLCEALARPERDPREDLPKPIFKRGVLKLEDLVSGMELKGTVLNVVDFGAFVDIGLKDSGLVHISQLANRYVKSPHDVVSVGDVATVWVLGVDPERKRVSLTMVEPGTERPRGGGGGGGGGGGRRGEPQEGGAPPREGGRRGGGPRGRREGGPPGGPRSQDAGPQPAAGPTRGARVPGPPQRAQQARRGGPRRQGAGARLDRSDRPAMADRPPMKPKGPPPPPAPLSKDAIAGNAPLRTFGQLKQLFEMRGPDAENPEAGSQATTPPEPTLDQSRSTPRDQAESGATTPAAPDAVAGSAPTSSEAPKNDNAGLGGENPQRPEEGASSQSDTNSGEPG